MKGKKINKVKTKKDLIEQILSSFESYSTNNYVESLAFKSNYCEQSVEDLFNMIKSSEKDKSSVFRLMNSLAYECYKYDFKQRGIDICKYLLNDINSQNHASVLDTLAVGYYLNEEFENAKKTIDDSIQLDNSNPEHLANKFRIYKKLKHFPAAFETLLFLKNNYPNYNERIDKETSLDDILSFNDKLNLQSVTYEDSNGEIKLRYTEFADAGNMRRFLVKFHRNNRFKNYFTYLNYETNQEDGFIETYHDNGELYRKVYVKNGLYQGDFFEYHFDGTLKRKGEYIDDEISTYVEYDQQGNSIKFF